MKGAVPAQHRVPAWRTVRFKSAKAQVDEVRGTALNASETAAITLLCVCFRQTRMGETHRRHEERIAEAVIIIPTQRLHYNQPSLVAAIVLFLKAASIRSLVKEA